MPAAEDLIDAASLAGLITAAVREAGGVALAAFRGAQKTWTKAGGSPVSEADMAVDALLHDRLLGATPEFGWLSEESADNPARLAAPAVWIVDPIDGTRAYIAGLEDWSISVALVQGGRPVLGAVYVPVTDEFFLAAKDRGATRNGIPICASTGGHLVRARIAGPKNYLNALTSIAPDAVPTPRIHSLALRIVRVAEGGLDVAFAGGQSHDWDLAAADLLVHEARGVLTTLAGERVIYNRPDLRHEPLIAAGYDRHAALLGLMDGLPLN